MIAPLESAFRHEARRITEQLKLFATQYGEVLPEEWQRALAGMAEQLEEMATTVSAPSD